MPVYQRQIPGGPFINESTYIDVQIPGGSYFNNTATLLNFPTSPDLDDVYLNWIWKGTSWKNIYRVLPNNTNILDFPSSPSLNDIYGRNGLYWIWNGTSWKTLLDVSQRLHNAVSN